MKKTIINQKKSVDIIEESVLLLVSAPLKTIFIYYISSIPFILGFLFFFTEMSTSPLANKHSVSYSLVLVLLFIWMKTGQAVFLHRLRFHIFNVKPSAISLKQIFSAGIKQLVIQAWGLFAVLVSSIMVLPFSWVFAFFQNVTVFACDNDISFKDLIKKSYKNAVLWPKQNIYIILIITLFSIFVFLNIMVVILWLPQFIRTVAGIEFLEVSSWTKFNTTLIAVSSGIAFLCIDPLFKAVYALRCFYGESIKNGDDLKVELKRFFRVPRSYIIILSIILFNGIFTPVSAADNVYNQGISPQELHKSVSAVLKQRKYMWKFPREEKKKEHSGLIMTFLKGIKKVFNYTMDKIYKFLKWLFSGSKPLYYDDTDSSFNWLSMLRTLTIGCIVTIFIIIVYLITKTVLDRKVPDIPSETGINSKPDLNDENVTADALPFNSWLKLAKQLLDEGKLRLALRSYFLASLSFLDSRKLIILRKYKSNKDYLRELSEKSSYYPELIPVFTSNMNVFERIWYGQYSVNKEILNGFIINFDSIKTILAILNEK